MAYSSPLDEMVDAPGAPGDVERASLERPPLAGELPEQTVTRVAQQNRIRAEDLASRGIPHYTNASGDVAPVTDDTGSALTHLDKTHGVAYDSAGQPKLISYDGVSGPPSLKDPFAGLPEQTDKAGNRFRSGNGLYQWDGTDDAVVAANAQKQQDKETAHLAALTGRKLSLDEYDLHQGTKEHNDLRESLQKQVPALLDPKFKGADPETVINGINDHFNAQYATPEANATKGWFSNDMSPEAAALRSDIDARKAKAMDTAQSLFAKKEQLAGLSDSVGQARAQERLANATLLAHAQGQPGPLDNPPPQQAAPPTPDEIPALVSAIPPQQAPEQMAQAVHSGVVPAVAGPAAVAASHDAADAQQKADALRKTNPTLADQFEAVGKGILTGLGNGIAELVKSPIGQGVAGLYDISPVGLALHGGRVGGLTPGVNSDIDPAEQTKKFADLISSRNPEMSDKLKDTVGGKIGNFVGGVLPYVANTIASGPAAPVTDAAMFFSSGYQNTYDDAKAHGADENTAHGTALVNGAINAALALPLRVVGKAYEAVFGDTAPKVITRAISNAYDHGGPEAVGGLLGKLSDAIKAGGEGAEQLRQEAVEGIGNVMAEITKTPAQRALDVAKTAALHGAIGGGVQTAQNIVSQTYDHDRGTFDNVPEQALGFAALAGISKGFEQVAAARKAKQALDIIAGGGTPPDGTTLPGPKGKPTPPTMPPEATPPAGEKPVAGRDVTGEQSDETSNGRNDVQVQPAAGESAEAGTPAAKPSDAPRAVSEPVDANAGSAGARAETPAETGGQGGEAGKSAGPVAVSEDVKRPPLYRGTTKTQWAAIQRGETPQSEFSSHGLTWTTTDKDSATSYSRRDGKGEAVVIEYKDSAHDKVDSITDDPGDKRRQGKLGLDDVQRVTDHEGNVLYDADAPKTAAARRNVIETGDKISTDNTNYVVGKVDGDTTELRPADKPNAEPLKVPTSTVQSRVTNNEWAHVKGEVPAAGSGSTEGSTANQHAIEDARIKGLQDNLAESARKGVAADPEVSTELADLVQRRQQRPSVDTAAHEAATSPTNDLPEPTQPQKEAGNYQKGHVTVGGLDISIENPAGSKRQPEFQPLQSHYGYIKGTVGADKDHVDIFVKQGTPTDYSGPVFVVNQVDQNGAFDEHKAVIGVKNQSEALAEYRSNYEAGWKGAHSVVKFDSPQAFKAWAESPATAKPASQTAARITPPDGGTAPQPQTEGEHVVSTAVKSGDRYLVGSTWNEPHEGIGMRHGLVSERSGNVTVPQSDRGFIVQDAKGNQRFAGRAEAGEIAKNAGQASPEAAANLQSSDLTPVKARDLPPKTELDHIQHAMHTGDTPAIRNAARQALKSHKAGDAGGYENAVAALRSEGAIPTATAHPQRAEVEKLVTGAMNGRADALKALGHDVKVKPTTGDTTTALGIGTIPDDSAAGATIHVDYDKLAKATEGYTPRERSRTIQRGIDEEITHVAAVKWDKSDPKNRAKVEAWGGEDDELGKHLAKHYEGWEHLSDWQKGHEKLRAVVQKRWTGRITETARSMFRDFIAYLRTIWDKLTPGQREIVQHVEGMLKGDTKAADVTKPVTPQVPNAPGTKYVLPSFATGNAGKLTKLQARANELTHRVSGIAGRSASENAVVMTLVRKGDGKSLDQAEAKIAKLEEKYATTTGKEQSGSQPEHTGVPSGTDVRPDKGEVRQENGGQAGGRGGAGERSPTPAPEQGAGRSGDAPTLDAEANKAVDDALEGLFAGLPKKATHVLTAAEDLPKQAEWLNKQAESKGFADLSELAERNPTLFTKLAVGWRNTHQATSLAAGGITQQAIPAEKIGGFITAATHLIRQGIDTPEKLATVLATKDPQARNYSQAFWDAIGMVKPELRGTHDWGKYYQPPAEQDEQKGQALPASSNPTVKLAQGIAARFAAEEPFDSKALFQTADRVFGGTQAEGKYTPKDAYDAMELGVNLYIESQKERWNPATLNEAGAMAAVRAMKTEILAKMPTMSKRTGEQDEFQQFSTPPPLGFVAAWVSNLKPSDVVLEPSAGIGGIAVWAKNAGVKEVHVNELSDRRRSILETQDYASVSGENAEHINAILDKAVKPTVVDMNPPFSASAGRIEGKRATAIGGQHVLSALQRLEPNGRLVAIVGQGMADGMPAFDKWWKDIKAKYNVRANIGVSGKEYAKYGTTFSNQLLVIDNDGPTTEPPVLGSVEKVEDLIPLLAGVRNDRPSQAAENAGGSAAGGHQPVGAQNSQNSGAGSGPRPAVNPSVSAVGTRPGNRGGRGNSDAVRTGSADGEGRSDGAPSTTDAGGRPADGPSEPATGTDGRPDRGSDVPAGAAESHAPVAVDSATVERADATNEPETDEVFSDYRPQKVKVVGAAPHPTPLVESSAMRAIAPPDPTYVPKLDKKLLVANELGQSALSLPQFEAVLYAGQATNEKLPDGKRGGFFIGDGTGVGKGREIAAIILDNRNQGRKKAIWISEKKGLIRNAQGDFADLGEDNIDIVDLGKTKSRVGKVELKDGMLFSTYATLIGDFAAGNVPPEFAVGATVRFRQPSEDQAGEFIVDRAKREKNTVRLSLKQGKKMFSVLATDTEPVKQAAVKNKSRVDQVVEWFGADYDGVIVFDEAHNAQNAIAMKGKRGIKQPSQTGLAVVALQDRLPNARIIYASATGATEVYNLAYADRLGLWGPGAPFNTKGDFFNNISNAGISAMEIVARDLKAMGKYISRTLGFGPADRSNPDDTGVEVDVLEHPLTPEQVAIYNRISQQWQAVYRDATKSLGATGADLNSNAKKNVRGRFFSSQQRFYNQLLTAMQTPTLLRDMRQQLDAGHSILIQLTNTNEATLDRALSKADDEERPLEELDLSPKDILMQYVQDSFPVQLYEKYTDENGNERSRLVYDSEGKPVLDPEAIAVRDKLLDDIGRLPVPANPLEQILDTFGYKNVAEITGRSTRVIQKEVDGVKKAVKETNRTEATRKVEAEDFKDGKRRILVFSDAGGTGFSYHSDTRFKNQQRRYHYLVQAGWRADKAIQGLGRGHRSGQRIPPFLKLLRTNIEGHKRFISTIARRLSQMGALTSGERRASQRGLFSDADNLENEYAETALDRMIRASLAGNEPALSWDVFTERLGFDNMLNEAGQLNETKMPDVPQFLNRLLMLEFEEQNAVFNAFFARMTRIIENAKEQGTFDPGLQTLKTPKGGVNSITGDEEVYKHPSVDTPTRLVSIEQTYPVSFRSWEDAKQAAGKQKNAQWLQQNKSGRVYLTYDESFTRTSDSGNVSVPKARLGIKQRQRETVDANKIDTAPAPRAAQVGETLTIEGKKLKIVSLPLRNGDGTRVKVVPADQPDATPMTLKAALRSGSTYSSQFDDLFELSAAGRFVDGVNDDASYLQKGGNYTELSEAEAHDLWEKELRDADPMEHDHEHFVVGLMLPIWNRLQLPHTNVYRVPMEKDSFLGVRIPAKSVAGVRMRLGANSAAITPQDVFTQVLKDGAKFKLANNWSLVRRRVSGDYRLEVQGPTWNDRNNFERYIGGFTERIGFETRYFLPTDPTLGVAALAKILATSPVADTETLGASNPKKIVVDYYDTDVEPLLKGVGLGLKDAWDMVRHVVSPTSDVPSPALDAAMKLLGERNQTAYVIDRLLMGYERMFDKLPQATQIDFVDRLKRGEDQTTPELQAAAAAMSKIDSDSWVAARDAYQSLGYKKDEIPLKWLDNHYRVMWKKLPYAEDADGERKLGGKRPLRGTQGMMKQHTLEDMSEGIAAGGVPHSYNPVVNFKMAQVDIWKLTTALKTWAWGKENKLVQFVRGKFPKVPEGMTWLDDNISRVYFPAQSGEGLIEGGRWAVEEGFGRILNNYLSRDLIRSSGLGRGLLWLKNATTAIELSLSVFHGVFETMEAVGSNLGLGLHKLVNRGIVGGDVKAIMDGLLDMIKAPVSPVTGYSLGQSIRKAAGNPEFYNTKDGKRLLKAFPNAREMIDDLFQGGWKPTELEQDWKNNSVRAFIDSLSDIKAGKDANYIGAGLRALPAFNEMLMKPLFEQFIPSLKVAQFFKEYSEALQQQKTSKRGAVLTRAALARQVWRLTEDRFGELNYDTLFWNANFKTAMQLMFRSVTWKLGSVEAFAGAFGGQAKEFVNAFKERRAPELHRNMAWLFGMLLLTVTMGTIMSRVLGGRTPKNLTDAVFPQIDPKDDKVRVSLPTYFKDMVHLIHAPGTYVTSSMAGWIGRVMDLMRNKDYYGVQIRDSDDSVVKQALQVGKFTGETMLPFSIRGYKNLSAQEVGTLRKALAALGVNPAPRYIAQTPAEQSAEQFWKGRQTEAGVRPEQFEASADKRKMVAQIRHGETPDISKALAKGAIKPTEITALYQRAGLGALASQVNRMPLLDAERVYRKASAAEKAQLEPIMARKRGASLARSGRTMFQGF